MYIFSICQYESFFISSKRRLLMRLLYSSIRMEKKGYEKYENIRELGTGSFGQVRLVRCKDTQQLYALKSVSLGRLNQKQKDGALNEVRLLASFDIPSVIKYEGSFYNDQTQQLCLVMQYADGGDLQQMIVNRMDQFGEGFNEPFIWRIAFEILQGVKVLHKNKVIHRDIKSANIFFVGNSAKLGDLNVSKLTENGLCSTNIGTPYYTAPQIWKGLQYDSKCDIWSIGCVIYELCCLCQPFKASDFPSLFRKVLKGEFAPVPEKYSENMKELVRMCLTSEPEMRPSASELLQNRIFQQVRRELEDVSNLQAGSVQLIQQIKCPRMMKLLNYRLPKVRKNRKQTTVTFASQQELEKTSMTKENQGMRRIRSQKVINWIDNDIIAPKAPFRKRIKLGSDKQEHSDHKIEGLSFSTKKLKLKIQSSKLIPDTDAPFYSEIK